LLDMNASRLVPHSAEIDYLDPQHPLVMIFPAQPLQHNNHYAVAVVNATDKYGNRLDPNGGFVSLMRGTLDTDRRDRYFELILPTLETAASWFSYPEDPASLQLLFDFVTTSEISQLGPVRAVRDGALNHIDQVWEGDWREHVRVIRTDDFEYMCDRRGSNKVLARTIHAELDVPWYLARHGPGARSAILDETAVASGLPTTIGTAKFVVHVPCSIRAAALGDNSSKPIRAFMEYGHGLFFTREEAADHFLLKMAHDQGYVIVAMDWRGMSLYDLLIVGKTLLSTPHLFEAVRDNLIQGYANKFALQHFLRQGIMSTDWFAFKARNRKSEHVAPTWNGTTPSRVFYGISQGGILGAGYTALSKGLFERSILGVPGTPFSLIMSRSLDFSGYDALMLLNFYDNRHVRILLALIQMGWDSVEGSGVLATPVNEAFPPILMQAGLGDAIVPTIAAEALARGFGALVLKGHPRSVYGLSENDNSEIAPHVTLTELLYEEEYAGLPVDDTYGESNSVHVCVRLDESLIEQICEFINTGKVIDPCASDQCHRKHSC
jgi:hypothetical protein